MTTRFYPCLLFYEGALRWKAQMLDFEISGRGNTQDEAKNNAEQQLQEHINAMDDQEKQLPHPSHYLVVGHKLVAIEAHGWALIGVQVNVPSDMQDIDDNLVNPKETKEKSNATRNQRGKKKFRS